MSMTTITTKLPESILYSLLNETSAVFAGAEHQLFVEQYLAEINLNRCKKSYLSAYGLTARQFNAVAFNLKGKVEAARESQAYHIANLQETTRSLEKYLKVLEKKLKEAKKDSEKQKIRFGLHQKKRRLHALRRRLAALEADRKAGKVCLCFGGKKLFHAQFHLKENGYAGHQDWLKDWQSARASQFLCLGSKDETFGNQTCTFLPNGNLRLRVMPALEGTWGRWVLFENVRFRYGQERLGAALAQGKAVTYRFFRRLRKGKPVWYLAATFDREDAGRVTSRRLGGIGVDLNPAHLDIGEIDRFGNPVGGHSILLELQGRRQSQVKAALAEAVADIVDRALSVGKPIIIEKLDFRRKKAGLREESPRYARMLSAFAYRQFHALLHSRAARNGVEIIEVNPAYTSIIIQAMVASTGAILTAAMSHHNSTAQRIGQARNGGNSNILPLMMLFAQGRRWATS